MAFKDLIRKQRQAGAGILPAIGGAAGASIREALDIRNLLFTKGSVLGALFPNIKGFKADAAAPKTRKSPTSLASMGTSSSALSDAKLDIISQNTKISAKNSMMLPSMARDMNVMRQNIVKLVKLSGGKASTKADAFFMKAAERERAYEAQMQESKSSSPTAVTDTDTSKEKGGMFAMIMKTLVGILALVGLGATAYFTSPKFKKLVDDRVIEPLREGFNKFKDKLEEVGKDFLLVAAGIVAGYIALKAIVGAAVGKMAMLALANPKILAAALAVAVGAYLISRDRQKLDEMERIRQKENLSRSDPDAPKLTPEEQAKWDADKKRSAEGQEKWLDELHAPATSPMDSAAGRALQRFLGVGVGKGDAALRGEQTPTPVPEEPQSSSTPERVQTPTSELGGIDYSAYAQAIGQRESGGDYKKVNTLGFVGKYQFGAEALEDLKLVKPGVGKMGNNALNEPSNWTIPGGKEAFLNNPALQEETMVRFTEMMLKRIKRMGVIDETTPPETVAGYLGASHIGGQGGAADLKSGIIRKDAYGTKTSEYFDIASASQGGSLSSTQVASSSRIPGAQIASASMSAEQFRMESMDALSMIPSMLGLLTPKTPSTPAQQVSIPSTIDSDLFDALVMRVTEYS